MTGTNSTLGGGGFHHLAIRARHFDKSMDFYIKALGFTPKVAWGAAPRRAVMLDTGDGNYLEVFEATSFPSRPAQAPSNREEDVLLHMAIRTADCDAAFARAQAAGAAVIEPPKDVTLQSTPTPPGSTAPGSTALTPSILGPVPVRIAFVKGPDGEVIEFFQNSAT